MERRLCASPSNLAATFPQNTSITNPPTIVRASPLGSSFSRAARRSGLSVHRAKRTLTSWVFSARRPIEQPSEMSTSRQLHHRRRSRPRATMRMAIQETVRLSTTSTTERHAPPVAASHPLFGRKNLVSRDGKLHTSSFPHVGGHQYSPTGLRRVLSPFLTSGIGNSVVWLICQGATSRFSRESTDPKSVPLRYGKTRSRRMTCAFERLHVNSSRTTETSCRCPRDDEPSNRLYRER